MAAATAPAAGTAAGVPTREHVALAECERWLVGETCASLEASVFMRNEASLHALELGYVQDIAKLRERDLASHMQALSDQAIEREASEQRALRDLGGAVAAHKVREIARRAATSMENDERQRTVSRNWRRILRSVSSARSMWGSLVDEAALHWRLDMSESFMRMRIKLEPNYGFSDHALAAARRDRLHAPGAAAEPGERGRERASLLGRRGGVRRPQASPANVFSLESVKMLAEDKQMPVSGASGASGAASAGTSSGAAAAGTGASAASWSPSSAGAWPGEPADAGSAGVVEKIVYACDCAMITMIGVVRGRLELSNLAFRFNAVKPEAMDAMHVSFFEDRSWSLGELVQLYTRRYRTRQTAMEFFFADRSSILLNFAGEGRVTLVQKLLATKPPRLDTTGLLPPEEIFRRSTHTQRWLSGELSNFEYLMWLNTIAGRSYHDLNQYPVFPWVLADYSSASLNLADPAIYRDLSRPMGAQLAASSRIAEARYAEFASLAAPDDDFRMPPFHHGSHYSSGGVVMYFMLRVEPFTSLHVELQGGKFDHADRLFSSLAGTWSNCVSSGNDPKELIPELYCLPELLVNSNRFDLGVRAADAVRVDDVQLPPWAADAHEFVRIHRAALESAHVRAHLHDWINLIFGFQQQGEEAVRAVNVFYFLTYENAIDLDAIEDETLRKSYEVQIGEFGQTPSQLLSVPHVAADPAVVRPRSITELGRWGASSPSASAAVGRTVQGLSPSGPSVCFERSLGDDGTAIVCLIQLNRDTLLSMSATRELGVHRWSGGNAGAGAGADASVDVEPRTGLARRLLEPSFAKDYAPESSSLVVLADGRSLVSCGHWDHSLRVHLLDGAGAGGASGGASCRTIQTVREHGDVVTCLVAACEAGMLVSGSRDSSVIIWNLRFEMAPSSAVALVVPGLVGSAPGGYRLDPLPRHVLCGHDDEVTALAVSANYDVVLSGSRDGTCIVHTLREGKYVRSLVPPCEARAGAPASANAPAAAISRVAIAQDGRLVVACDNLTLCVYSINAQLLARTDTLERVSQLLVTRDGHCLTNGDRRQVIVRALHNLAITHRVRYGTGALTCLAFSSDELRVLIGTDMGNLVVL